MVIICSDHAGFELKEKLKKFLTKQGIKFFDNGTYSKDSVNYPEIAYKTNKKVLEDSSNMGIYICGTGIGMSIACNRNPKIRGALCYDVRSAELSRRHNNANVLVLKGRHYCYFMTKKIVKKFLSTSFDGGRHQVRVDMLTNYKEI
jgi:ribose 5-phosphate isomerase B